MPMKNLQALSLLPWPTRDMKVILWGLYAAHPVMDDLVLTIHLWL